MQPIHTLHSDHASAFSTNALLPLPNDILVVNEVTILMLFPPLMKSDSTLQRMHSLMSLIQRRGYPSAVHLATEAGFPEAGGRLTLIDTPRLSICLSESSRYLILQNGVQSEIRLNRGEAIYVLPGCIMEPHPEGKYLSLGIVFHHELTRFLFAKKLPASPVSFFLLTHHSFSSLDQDGWNICRAIGNCKNSGAEDGYILSLMRALLHKTKHLLEEKAPASPQGKAYFTWQAACQYIKEHMQQPLDRNSVAAFLNLHPNHVSRLFAKFSERSFQEYVLDTRLARASDLLKNPTLNITEIAHSSGFSDSNYFIRCFRRKFGRTPSRARNA